MAIALACVALAAATAVFVFLVERDPGAGVPLRTRLDQLMERRDAIYENLRDLKFEHRAGKFSEADFEEMKNSMETEAAVVLAEMEALTGGTPSPAARQAAHNMRRKNV